MATVLHARPAILFAAFCVAACDGDSTAPDPAVASDVPEAAEDVAVGAAVPQLDVARATVAFLREDLVLDGFFRPDGAIFHPSKRVLVPDVAQPWIPVPAEGGAHPPGVRLGPEYAVNPADLGAAMDRASGTAGAVRRDVLTALLKVAPTGRMSIEWVGAAPGLLAMRGGQSRRGESAEYHAIEAQDETPFAMALSGLPQPRAGSLRIAFDGYLDPDVATRLTVRVPEGGVIACERQPDGSIWILPGVAN